MSYKYEDGKSKLCKPGVLRRHCEGVLGHWAAGPGQLGNRRRGGRPGKLLPRGSVRAPLGSALSSADGPLDCCERPAAARRGRVATVCAPAGATREAAWRRWPEGPRRRATPPPTPRSRKHVTWRRRNVRFVGPTGCRGNGPIGGRCGRALQEVPRKEPA